MKYLLAGLALIGLAISWLPYPQQTYRKIPSNGPNPPICYDGHPNPYFFQHRQPVTYGGYRQATINNPCQPGERCCPFGTVRNHRFPTCLGGPDVPVNVWCQDYDQSLRKAEIERVACDSFCSED